MIENESRIILTMLDRLLQKGWHLSRELEERQVEKSMTVVAGFVVASARLLAVVALDGSTVAYHLQHPVLLKQLPIHHPFSFPSPLQVAFPLI